MKTWTKFLAKKGYEVEYDRYHYWNDVMYAVKDKERIPIAIIEMGEGRTSIIKHFDIAVSQKNFDILRALQLEFESGQIPNYPVEAKIVWRNNKYTLKEV